MKWWPWPALRVRGCLTVLFIFGCGLLAGGFLGATIGWIGCFNRIVGGGPDAVQWLIIERVRGDLKLKGEQRQSAKLIVQETALELDSATASVRPQVADILGRSEQRLRAILNEKQRRKFDGALETSRRRWNPAPSAQKP